MSTGKQDIDPNKKERNKVSEASEAQKRKIAELSVDADSEYVAGGYRASNPERAIESMLQKAKKEKNKSKSHKISLNQIKDMQTRLNDLRQEAAKWGKIADELEDKLGGLDSIGEKSGTERKPNESDKDYEKRVIEDTLALVAAGLLDPDSDQALWAVARDRENQINDAINDIENTSDPVEQRARLEAVEERVLYEIDTSTDNILKAADTVIEKNKADVSEAPIATEEENDGSKMSAFQRMRAARASMPGKDIESETMPEIKEHFVAAVSNTQPESVTEINPVEPKIDFALS